MTFKAGSNGNGNGKRKGKNRAYGERKTRRAGKGLVIFLIILALVVAGGGTGYFFISREVTGKRGGEAVEATLNIQPGTYAGGVAQMLKDEDIIGSVNIFKAYLRFFSSGPDFTQGQHTVNSAMHYDDIIAELRRATYDDGRPTFSVTFPEGTTCLKMAWILEEAGFCTTQEFLDVCNNDVFDVGFYDMISDSPNKFVKLEGFLYPDTYEFYMDATVHEIVQTMLENFESKVMTEEMMADIEASPYTFEEAVIFGSIVQKESYGGEEFNVAGVFYNRMHSDEFTCLESCTTNDFRWYVLWEFYGSEAATPAAMDAAYDTYGYGGFPVGAICNPGADMIYAALHPADTPYYFFCTNVETKEFFWAVTNAEHEANLRKAGIK